jgi:hypothetical protein
VCCVGGFIVVVDGIGFVGYLFWLIVGVRGMLMGLCVRCVGLLGIVGVRFMCVCGGVVTVCICFYLVWSSDGWLLVVGRSVVVVVVGGAVSFLDVL